MMLHHGFSDKNILLILKMLFAVTQISSCRCCLLPAAGLPVHKYKNNSRYDTWQKDQRSWHVRMEYSFAQHIVIEIVYIRLISTVRILLHILIYSVQNMINVRIRISVLHDAGRTEPRIDFAVILPVPVVDQKDAVAVCFIIAEIVFLIELFCENSDELIIRHACFDFPRIFFQ